MGGRGRLSLGARCHGGLCSMEYTLKLGEKVTVGRALFTKRCVLFAGEVSPGVFSVVAEWTEAHNSAACNLYFQKSQREFPLLGGRLTVLDVSRHELRLRFER
jgi:hypothetical protein